MSIQFPMPDEAILARRDAIIAGLAPLVPESSLITTEDERRAFETDALTAYRRMPLAVVLPTTTEEVAAVLKFCNEQGVKVIPRGAGTSLAGGAIPQEDAIVVGVGKMNRVLDINFGDRTMRVQSGITNLAISGEVAHKGFFYAPDPSSQLACTIAGNIAMNSGGAHCLRYGVTTNNILGVRMVLIDGTIVDIGSDAMDAAGLDLLGLVIERITGMALGAFLHERLFAPLGMRDTAFHLRPEDISRLARPFPADPLSGAALLDPDQTFDAAVPPRLHSGGAGALSSAPDYVRFARMLLEGGTLDGVRILSPASIRLMTADHLGTRVATPVAVGEAALQSPGYGFGLGLAVRLADGLASVPGSKGDCFWSGTAGTTFWIDKTARLAVVFMAQAPGEMRLRLRRLVRQLVYAALD